MPVSKGRKKKSKNKNKSSNKAERSHESNGIKISQKGNMTYVQNKRSKFEQEKFVNHVIENRPIFFNEIKRDIDAVVNEISHFDKISLLGILSYYQMAHQFTDDGQGEVVIEYAQSICTALPNLDKGTIPTFKQADNIIKQLIHIRHAFSHFYSSEKIAGKYSEVEGNIRLNMLLQSLFIRGDGYYQHVKIVFEELFKPHDDFFTKHYGFTSADIMDTFEQLEDSFCCRVVMPNGMPHMAGHSRFTHWSKNTSVEEGIKRGVHPIVAFGEDNPDLIVREGKVIMYRMSDISGYPELFKIRPRYETHKKVIEALAISFGHNEAFLNPDYKAEPLNDSLIYKYPIIKEGNEYYLFGFNIGSRNLLSIAENLIEIKDKAYYNNHYLGNKYTKTRDSYLEKKVEDIFKAFLPTVNFYPNVKYSFLNDGSTINCNKKNEQTGVVETELDLLGVGINATYLIEIKAGALNPAGKRGAIKSLTMTLKDVVGYAACQGFRAQKFIKDNDNPAFQHGKDEVIINKEKPIYRISVSLDHLGGLMTYLYDLKELDIIDKNVDFAWTLSLYDLIIFSEIIKDEDEFQEYLKARIELYPRANIYIEDEISLLGYFYHEGNILFDNVKIGKSDHFQINKNYSADIDRYFMNEFGGQKSPKPRRRATK